MPAESRKRKLTDAFVKSTACAAIDGATTEYFDAAESGLAIRVTPRGTKTWTLRYRPLGSKTQKRLKLGRFDPAAGRAHLGVADARLKAKAARVEIGEGNDPAADKVLEREARANAKTLGQIGHIYFEKAATGEHRMGGRPKKVRTIADERRYFERFVDPQLGKLKIETVTRSDINEFLETVPGKGNKRQCRVILNGIFGYALWQEMVPANPILFVQAASFEPRNRTLSDSELSAIWRALDNAVSDDTLQITRPVVIALLLCAATLQRRGEVAGIHQSEIDFANRRWVIPGERTKNRRAHVVPLSPLSASLLEEATTLADGSGFLFPSPARGIDEDKSITADALTKAWGRLCRVLQIKDARVHDLRRTGASNIAGRLQSPRVERFIISRILNHRGDSGGAARVTDEHYALFDYVDEKRDALDRWAALLSEIVQP